MAQIELGKVYRDKVTGFEGMAIVRTFRAFGDMTTITLEPIESGEKKPSNFAEIRLTDTGGQPVEPSSPPDFEFGEEYVDTITGFKGKATIWQEHLYGCVHVYLECMGKDEHCKLEGFDEQRIKPTAEREMARAATSGSIVGSAITTR